MAGAGVLLDGLLGAVPSAAEVRSATLSADMSCTSCSLKAVVTSGLVPHPLHRWELIMTGMQQLSQMYIPRAVALGVTVLVPPCLAWFETG